MKKILKEKCKKIVNWLKKVCKDYRTLVIFLCVIIVMYIPVWGGFLLYYIFKKKIFLSIATIVIAFWIGPFTPFFPIAIALTLFIKRLLQIKGKKLI